MGNSKELNVVVKVKHSGLDELATTFQASMGKLDTSIKKLQTSMTGSLNRLKNSLNSTISTMGTDLGKTFADSFNSTLNRSFGNSSSSAASKFQNQLRKFVIKEFQIKPSDVKGFIKDQGLTNTQWRSKMNYTKETNLWRNEMQKMYSELFKNSGKSVNPITEYLKKAADDANNSPQTLLNKLAALSDKTLGKIGENKKSNPIMEYYKKAIEDTANSPQTLLNKLAALSDKTLGKIGGSKKSNPIEEYFKKSIEDAKFSPQANLNRLAALSDKYMGKIADTVKVKKKTIFSDKDLLDQMEVEANTLSKRYASKYKNIRKDYNLDKIQKSNIFSDKDLLDQMEVEANGLAGKYKSVYNKIKKQYKVGSGGTTEKTGVGSFLDSYLPKYNSYTEAVKSIIGVNTELSGSFLGIFNVLKDGVLNIFEKFTSLATVGIGVVASLAIGVTGAAYAFKEWGSYILLTTERFRGYNIAMLGTLKTQAAVDDVMKTSMKISQNLPIGIEQIYSGTKAMTLISPLQTMFKDSKNLESNMREIWDIVVALSQIEPEWGIQGALYSLRETLSGDFMSIKRRYEIPVDVMVTADGKPLSSVKTDIPKLIKGLYSNLKDMVPEETMKMTSNQFGSVMQKIQGQFELLKNNIGEAGFYDIFVKDMKKIQAEFTKFVGSGDAMYFAKRISNAFENAWATAKQLAVNSISFINKIFHTNLKLDTSSISSTIADLVEKLVHVMQYATAFVGNGQFQNAVADIIDKVKTGIVDIYNYLTTNIPKAIQFVSGSIKTVSGYIESILSYTDEFINRSTLVKGAIGMWAFGFGNIVALAGQFLGTTAGIYSTYKLVNGASSKLSGDMNATAAASSTFASSCGSILKTFLAIETVLVMIPNTLNLMINSFELFDFTAMGEFVNWAKNKTGIGTPSKAWQYENDQQVYSNWSKSLGMPSELSAFLEALKTNPNVQKSWENYKERVSLHPEGEDARNGYVETIQNLINKYPNGLQKDFKGYTELMQENADLAKRLQDKYGTGSDYSAISWAKTMMYIANPMNLGDIYGKITGNTNSYSTTPVKVEIVPTGLDNFTYTSSDVNMNNWSDDNKQKLLNFNKLMFNYFGRDFSGGVYSANDKGHAAQAHYQNRAADITGIDPKLLTNASTFAKMYANGMQAGLSEIKLNPKYFTDEVQKVYDSLNPDIKKFITKESVSPYNKGSKRFTHVEFANAGVNADGSYYDAIAAADAAGKAAMTNKPVFDQEDNERITKALYDQVAVGLRSSIKEMDLKAKAYAGTSYTTDVVDEFYTQILGSGVKYGQQALEAVNTSIDSDFNKIFGSQTIDTMMGMSGASGVGGGITMAITNMLKSNEDVYQKLSPVGQIVAQNPTSQVKELFQKAVDTRDSSKQLVNSKLTVNTRKFVNANYDKLSKYYENMGTYGFHGDQSYTDILTSDRMNDVAILAYKEFIGHDQDIKQAFANIKSEANIAGTSLYDNLIVHFKQLNNDIEMLNNYGQPVPEKMKVEFQAIGKVLKAIDEQDTFNNLKNQIKTLDDELKNVDYTNPAKMAAMKAKVMSQGTRSQKQSYYSTYRNSLEFVPDSNKNSFMTGMESSTVAFKNWSETMYDTGAEVVNNLSSTFETGFFDFMTGKIATLGDMFKSMGRSILQSIGQIIAKMLAISATKIVLGIDANFNGGFSSNSGGASSWIGSLLGAFSGSGSFGGGTSSTSSSMVGSALNAITNPGSALTSLVTGVIGSKVSNGIDFSNILGKGGTLSKAWGGLKNFATSSATSWVLPAAAVATFLSQPGRVWGGTVDKTGAAQDAYNQTDKWRNELVARRMSDAKKYMYSSNMSNIADYNFAKVGYNTWTSGDGWFKGPKELHASADTSAYEASVKEYYAMLKSSAEESYQVQKSITDMKKQNEYAALKTELSYNQQYLDLLQSKYDTALATGAYTDADNYRDELYDMKTTVDELISQTTEAYKALVDEMVSVRKNFISNLTSIMEMKYISSSDFGTASDINTNDMFGIGNGGNSSSIIAQLSQLKWMSSLASSTQSYVTFGQNSLSSLSDLKNYIANGSIDYSVFDKSTKTNKADITEALNELITALNSKATLLNTQGQTESNWSNMFSDKTDIQTTFDTISKLEETVQFYTDSGLASDLIYGGAQVVANANEQLSEYYGTIASSISEWVDSGFLLKSVETVDNLSEDMYNKLKSQVETISFKSSAYSSIKDMTTDTFKSIYLKMKESFDEITNATGNTVDYSALTSMYSTVGYTSDTDMFNQYFEYQKSIIIKKILNLTEANLSTYDAQLELLELQAEQADYLKSKSEDSTAKLEEMLDGIGQTMKTRIAEEGTTSKGDTVFIDLRDATELANEMASLAKSNDPSISELIATLKKKLLGV